MTHLKYLRYVLRHKWFVFYAGLKLRAPIWRLLVHDLSKFRPSEWLPYAEHFYGRTLPEQDTAGRLRREHRFNRAWLLHQHRNDHHWQYWCLRLDDGPTILLDMPEAAIREMVADWCGAGRAITGQWDVKPWWRKNRERVRMSDSTFARVEALLSGMRIHS